MGTRNGKPYDLTIENKYQICGNVCRKFVRSKCTNYDQKYQIVKHNCGHIMAWGCFFSLALDPYLNLMVLGIIYLQRRLKNHMLSYTEWEMNMRWVFQQDKNNWISENNVSLME